MDDDGTPRRTPAGVLYLVVSGAPAPEGTPTLVAAYQAVGWQVMVFSTPAGTRFIDLAELERLTGEPVRSEYRMPGSGTPVPPADAVLACPLTFNSVNKFAHGHSDNFAVGLLCEMAGYGVPVVMVPHCKPQLASHPGFGASLETLRGMGVRVLFDPDAPYERRLPSWREVIDALPVRAGAGGLFPPLGLPAACPQASDSLGSVTNWPARLPAFERNGTRTYPPVCAVARHFVLIYQGAQIRHSPPVRSRGLDAQLTLK